MYPLFVIAPKVPTPVALMIEYPPWVMPPSAAKLMLAVTGPLNVSAPAILCNPAVVRHVGHEIAPVAVIGPPAIGPVVVIEDTVPAQVPNPVALRVQVTFAGNVAGALIVK